MAPHRVHFRKSEAKSSGRGALVCAASELMRTIWFWYRRITAPYSAPVAMSRVRPTKIHRFGDIVNPSHPPQARLVSASPLSNRRIIPGDVNHRPALFTPVDANAATRASFCPTAQVIQAAVTARLPRNNTAPRMWSSRCQLWGNNGRETTMDRRIATGGRGPVPANSLQPPPFGDGVGRSQRKRTIKWRGREVSRRHGPLSHRASRTCPKEQQTIPHPAFPLLGAKGHVPEHQTVVQLRPSRNRRGDSGCLPPIRKENLGIQQAVPGQ